MDNDGDMDVLSASSFASNVAWYKNLDGLGSFGSQQIINGNTSSSRSVIAADIDGDGDMDVVYDRSNSGQPSWQENVDGLGNFGPVQELTQDTWGSQYVIAVDLDNDGDMDVVNLEYGSNVIAWYENTDGLGSFGSKNIISTIIKPVKIVAADLDNDGDMDLASINHDDNPNTTAVYWHENTDGLGTFSPEQIISTNILGGRGIDAADLDNDGDMDVLSASIIDYKIACYENLTILGTEEENITEIALYPNPVKSTLQISSYDIVITNIAIYTILGERVLNKKGDDTQIDLSSLSTGLYLVKIQTENGELVRKVVKE
jgi:hypothetical protein